MNGIETVIGETSSNKYKFVIEETTREVNRVLTTWENNSDVRRSFETHSLFRSYLSKFLNAKFGWKHYVRYIKQFEPLPIIKNGKLVGISLSDIRHVYDSHIMIKEEFKDVIDSFDFAGFNEKWVRDNQHITNPKSWEVSNIEDISFNNIENIKF